MSNVISHTGIIDSIDNGIVHVRIVQHSACSSCKVASMCNSAEKKEKIIDVKCADAALRKVGDTVKVMAAQSVGMKAVMIAFVIPLMLIMTTITVTLKLGCEEYQAIVAGLSALTLYYVALYAMRSRLERALTFYLED